jgi:hypothetical protein
VTGSQPAARSVVSGWGMTDRMAVHALFASHSSQPGVCNDLRLLCPQGVGRPAVQRSVAPQHPPRAAPPSPRRASIACSAAGLRARPAAPPAHLPASRAASPVWCRRRAQCNERESLREERNGWSCRTPSFCLCLSHNMGRRGAYGASALCMRVHDACTHCRQHPLHIAQLRTTPTPIVRPG